MSNHLVHKAKQSHYGFTLVEMLVAIFIFSLAVSTMAVTVSRGLRSGAFVQNELTAQYLAIESIEIIKNRRDMNYLDANKPAWNDGILSECQDTSINDGCNVFMVHDRGQRGPKLSRLGSNGSFAFYNRDSITGKYTTSTTANTIFQQRVVTENLGADEIRIVSQVRWKDNTILRQVEYATNIFNWKPL